MTPEEFNRLWEMIHGRTDQGNVTVTAPAGTTITFPAGYRANSFSFKEAFEPDDGMSPESRQWWQGPQL